MNEWEWQLLEEKKLLENFSIKGVVIKEGSRVSLRPRPGGDIMDLALSGKSAVVEAIEQDYEGKIHVCVVLDDDPGRDIGFMRQPGHRFFFDVEEVEPIADALSSDALSSNSLADTKRLPRILVAGIGNIFLGDDAFGVEVAQQLVLRELPASVKVVDFGIRGYDLAYALLDGYDATILIDACPRGDTPGTLYVIEPDIDALAVSSDQPPIEAHSMNPMSVLRLARSMGGQLKRILLVGCEPATLGPEEGQMGLSGLIEAAIPEAIQLVLSVIDRLVNEDETFQKGRSK